MARAPAVIAAQEWVATLGLSLTRPASATSRRLSSQRGRSMVEGTRTPNSQLDAIAPDQQGKMTTPVRSSIIAASATVTPAGAKTSGDDVREMASGGTAEFMARVVPWPRDSR